jgi:hypothetical protein
MGRMSMVMITDLKTMIRAYLQAVLGQGEEDSDSQAL